MMSRLCACLLACLLFTQCSAPEAPKTRRPQSRFGALLKPDLNKVSPFEKAFDTASAGDRGTGSWLSRQAYGTKDAGGTNKSFGGGMKNFKSGEFNSGQKDSRFGSQEANFGRGKDSRFGGQSYATKDSRFGSQAARQGNKSFHGGNEEFATRAFVPGQKSLNANKHPVTEVTAPGDMEKSADSYDEDQVKRLLGR